MLLHELPRGDALAAAQRLVVAKPAQMRQSLCERAGEKAGLALRDDLGCWRRSRSPPPGWAIAIYGTIL
jgi:hypothetical protein